MAQVMVRGLTSHQFCLGLVPGLEAIHSMWVEFVFGPFFVLRGFSPGCCFDFSPGCFVLRGFSPV